MPEGILPVSGFCYLPMNAIEKSLDELFGTTADALYEQAIALRIGEGVRVNFPAAHRFFMLSALMGKRAAFYQLGLMNLRGEGRPVDKLRSARNLEMVASDLNRSQLKSALALAEEFPRTARLSTAALAAKRLSAEEKELANWRADSFLRQLAPG